MSDPCLLAARSFLLTYTPSSLLCNPTHSFQPLHPAQVLAPEAALGALGTVLAASAAGRAVPPQLAVLRTNWRKFAVAAAVLPVADFASGLAPLQAVRAVAVGGAVATAAAARSGAMALAEAEAAVRGAVAAVLGHDVGGDQSLGEAGPCTHGQKEQFSLAALVFCVKAGEYLHCRRPPLLPPRATSTSSPSCRPAAATPGTHLSHLPPPPAGLDSLGSVEVRNLLQASLHTELPATVLFDYPSINALARYLAGGDGGDRGVPASTGAAVVPRSLAAGASAAPALPAITAASCALHSAGGVLSSTHARDVVGPVPLSRWDVEAGPDATAARFGAFLGGAEMFDAALLGVSAVEAVLMDPQQRMLLESAAEAVSAAGAGGLTAGMGVYVGVAASDYGSLAARFAAPSGYHATSNALSVTCGRVSFALGASGPSVAIDTACSSSLVAMHAAWRELAAGSLRLAVVSGVHLQATSASTSYVWKAAMLSPEGRCKVRACVCMHV